MPRVTDRISAARSTPAARRIVAAWRSLTGGAGVRDRDRPTLLACSGGCDSSALVLTLGARSSDVVVGHVVHDLRARAEALADRDVAKALAARLGLRFIEREVRVSVARGNKEAAARRTRYAALVEMACESGCRFVATAHQADDVLETVLMRLLRGAGARGLGGPSWRRRLGTDVMLVRPMLGVTRIDAEEICRASGHAWAQDATNADTTRRRAALRARVLPVLREIEPRGALRAAASAGLIARSGRVIELVARRLVRAGQERVASQGAGRSRGTGFRWPRARVAMWPRVVAGEVLRRAARELTGGAGDDRRGLAAVTRAIDAARDGSPHARRFEWRGVVALVTSREVALEARAPSVRATPVRRGRSARPPA